MESPLIAPKSPPPKNKRQNIIILLGIGVLLGFYFSQDEPQALQTYLQDQTLNFQLSSAAFNLIYFTTMFPNVFLNVIGGMIIDKIGVIKSVVAFSLVIFLAQALVTFSIYWKQNDQSVTAWYILLLVGRGIYGVGAENIHTVISAIVTIIIPSQRLSTGLGLCLSIPFAFGALNTIVSTSVYDATKKLYVPFLIGSAACFFSFVIAIVTAIYFRKITKKVSNQFVQTEQQSHAQKIQCSKITKLGSTFWLLIILCCNMAGLWYGFLDNALQCMTLRWNISNSNAGKIAMIPYLVCASCCPFYGYLAAKFLEKRRLLILTVPILCTLSHVIIYILPNLNDTHHKYPPTGFQYGMISVSFVLLGLSYSGYVSMIVPSISMVVDQSILGTAFGLVGMANALSESFFPMISSLIIETVTKKQEDKAHHGYINLTSDQLQHYAQAIGYQYNSIFFMGVGVLTVLIALILYLSKQNQARQLDTLDIQVEQIDWQGDLPVEEIDRNFAISFKKKNMTEITQKSIQSDVTQKQKPKMILVQQD